MNLTLLVALAGTVRDAGPAPSGVVYAALTSHHGFSDMSASEFQAYIHVLVTCKAISQSNFMLTWLNDAHWNATLDAVDAALIRAVK